MYIKDDFALKNKHIFKGATCFRCGNDKIEDFVIHWTEHKQIVVCKKCTNVLKKLARDYIEYLITEYNFTKEDVLKSIGNYYDKVEEWRIKHNKKQEEIKNKSNV